MTRAQSADLGRPDTDQPGGYQFKRDSWSGQTFKAAASSAWTDLAIRFDSIKLDKPVSLIGRSRFGEVHK